MKTQLWNSIMKHRTILALVLLSFIICTSVRAAAPRYLLINLGSLGGTNFNEFNSGLPGRLLNNSGTIVGGMDTSATNPFTTHALEWTDGSLTDLGTL